MLSLARSTVTGSVSTWDRKWCELGWEVQNNNCNSGIECRPKDNGVTGFNRICSGIFGCAHRIIWTPDNVTFQVLRGNAVKAYQNGNEIYQYQAKKSDGHLISNFDAPVLMKLYCTGDWIPRDSREIEIVLH